MTEHLTVGMQVRVNVPDKPELDGEGFIICELLPGDGRQLFQVDMDDHDNWFPAKCLKAID